MRTRIRLAGFVLAGLCAACVPATATAAIWPFSLFAKKTPVKPPPKRAKPKPGQARYGTRIKPAKSGK